MRATTLPTLLSLILLLGTLVTALPRIHYRHEGHNCKGGAAVTENHRRAPPPPRATYRWRTSWQPKQPKQRRRDDADIPQPGDVPSATVVDNHRRIPEHEDGPEKDHKEIRREDPAVHHPAERRWDTEVGICAEMDQVHCDEHKKGEAEKCRTVNNPAIIQPYPETLCGLYKDTDCKDELRVKQRNEKDELYESSKVNDMGLFWHAGGPDLKAVKCWHV
jgi:hypothetical protein